MPGDRDFQKREYDYKNSLEYRGIQSKIERGNLEGALNVLYAFTQIDDVEKKHHDMVRLLLKDYENGDHSEFLIKQLKRTLEEFFTDLAQKGIIPVKTTNINPYNRNS